MCYTSELKIEIGQRERKKKMRERKERQNDRERHRNERKSDKHTGTLKKRVSGI
jgi:hypothetical protein